MILSDPRILWGGVAGGVDSSRGLETRWFPRAVPIKRYDLKRLSLKGELSPGSGEGQSSRKIESRTFIFRGTETERTSNQRTGCRATWPMTSVRAHGRNAVRDGIGS